jgi:hypothetical protein
MQAFPLYIAVFDNNIELLAVTEFWAVSANCSSVKTSFGSGLSEA